MGFNFLDNRTMNFKNKTVWITGASSGIGEALAYELSNQGANLVLSARREEALKAVAKNCNSNVQIWIETLDVAHFASLPEKAKNAIQKAGQIDILINNAGVSQRSLAKDTDFSVDERLININLLGTIALTKAVLPYMLTRKTGHFVVMSSLMGKFSSPLRSSYAAAKHGLHGFFDALRMEIEPEGLQVTMVCPGFIKTDISKNALVGDGEKQGKMDDAQDAGMLPSELAKKVANAIYKKKDEVYFGGKETLAIYLKRLSPKLLKKVVMGSKVT